MKTCLKVFTVCIVIVCVTQFSFAQPQFPCAPGTECPPVPEPCSQQSDCVPAQDPDPIGDAIPLDGASTILLLIGAGLAAGKRIHSIKSKNL